MGEVGYTEIIDYAIKREQEAVQFYRELIHFAKLASQREMIREIMRMEESHEKLLKKMKKKSPGELRERTADWFEPASYLVEAPPTGEMSLQDILIIAMKREERSYALYRELQEQTDSEELRQTFEVLAGEETQHKKFFQELYDTQVQADN
ncbi:MAG: ferritin family protein [Spirochaetaceae bacterium]